MIDFIFGNLTYFGGGFRSSNISANNHQYTTAATTYL